jgi:hypothetical protein
MEDNVEGIDNRSEESHADGSVDVSNHDHPGTQEHENDPGKIQEREQVVLGSTNSDGPLGLQGSLDPRKLGDSVESETHVHETPSKPNSSMEIVIEMKIEKPMRGLKLEIKKKTPDSPHSTHVLHKQSGGEAIFRPRSGNEAMDGHSKQDSDRSADTHRIGREETSTDRTFRIDQPMGEGSNSMGQMGELCICRRDHVGPEKCVEAQPSLEADFRDKHPLGRRNEIIPEKETLNQDQRIDSYQAGGEEPKQPHFSDGRSEILETSSGNPER